MPSRSQPTFPGHAGSVFTWQSQSLFAASQYRGKLLAKEICVDAPGMG
jgi:hypothetical protein